MDESVPHLCVLEEDDKFKEFAVQGELPYVGVPRTSLLSRSPFGAQIGTTPKPIWRILEVLLQERPSRKEISFGRVIGTMMTLKRPSVCS